MSWPHEGARVFIASGPHKGKGAVATHRFDDSKWFVRLDGLMAHIPVATSQLLREWYADSNDRGDRR